MRYVGILAVGVVGILSLPGQQIILGPSVNPIVQSVTLSSLVSAPASTGSKLYNVGGTLYWAAAVSATTGATSPAITAGSGTGVTVNEASAVRRVVYKVTVASTQFVTAGLTHDVTIATLPAKTRLVGVYADLTTTFACTATCTTATLSMTVGTAAGGTQVLASFDADSAAAVFGDADGELGASVNAAARVQDAYIASWSAAQAISARLTSGTGNLGDGSVTNLSQGSVTFYLITESMP